MTTKYGQSWFENDINQPLSVDDARRRHDQLHRFNQKKLRGAEREKFERARARNPLKFQYAAASTEGDHTSIVLFAFESVFVDFMDEHLHPVVVYHFGVESKGTIVFCRAQFRRFAPESDDVTWFLDIRIDNDGGYFAGEYFQGMRRTLMGRIDADRVRVPAPEFGQYEMVLNPNRFTLADVSKPAFTGDWHPRDYERVNLETPTGRGTVKIGYSGEWGQFVEHRDIQFGQASVASGKRQIVEFAKRMACGRRLKDADCNSRLFRGKCLEGLRILLVPEQATPIPPDVLAAAHELDVQIRDPDGKVYNP